AADDRRFRTVLARHGYLCPLHQPAPILASRSAQGDRGTVDWPTCSRFPIPVAPREPGACAHRLRGIDRVARPTKNRGRLAGRLGRPVLLPHRLDDGCDLPLVYHLALGRPPDPLGSAAHAGLGDLPRDGLLTELAIFLSHPPWFSWKVVFEYMINL